MSPKSSFKAWKPLGENHIGQELHSCQSFHFSIIYIENVQPSLSSLQTVDIFTMGIILFYTTYNYGHIVIILIILLLLDNDT